MNRFRDNRPGNRGGGRGRGRGRGDRGQQHKVVEEIWPGYLKDGYFDEHGHLRPQYVSRESVEPLIEAMAKARPALTMSQLRRFFQHCRRVESRLRRDGVEWGEVLPQVIFLDAVAQAAVRQNDKVPDLFFDFIRCNVAAVKSPKDFLDGFVLHFEALVGFGAIHIKNR